MMNILGGGTELIDPGWFVFGAFGDLIKRRDRLPDFGFREYSGSFQGSRPGTIDSNLVRQEATVERKRALEGVETCVGRGFEAATPQAIVLSSNHSSPQRVLAGYNPALRKTWPFEECRRERARACCAPTRNFKSCGLRLWLSVAR